MSTRGTAGTTSAMRPGTTRRVFLGDARIQSKLAVILVVPVLAIVTLAALRLVDTGRGLREANMARALATVSVDATELAHELQTERMAAAALLLGPDEPASAYTRQGAATAVRGATYRHDRAALPAVPVDLSRRLDRVDRGLNALDGMRTQVLDRQGASPAEVVLRYGLIVEDIVAYQEAVSQAVTDPVLSGEMRAVAAFARARSQVAEEQAVVYMALKATRYGPEQLTAVLSALIAQQDSLAAFDAAADSWQRALVATTVTGDAVTAADRLANQVSHSGTRRPALRAEDAARTVGVVGDLMRGTQRRLDARTLADAGALADRMTWRTLAEAGLLLTILLVVGVLAVALARALARSLNGLRDGALAVADQSLPAAVARLRELPESGVAGAAGAVALVAGAGVPVAVEGRDEIGQVAQAVNAVHREAVRIAVEQAAMRTTVSAMFVSLARRSQTLADRMIGELDRIERGEEDPKRLAWLFQLDHLATRIRRNDENLLILSGADWSPGRREDAALTDVLRAAQSEIELYDRVEFSTVDPDVSVVAPAVNDVVRLLAELMDNATRYAPPSATAVADARRIGDHLFIEIGDRGPGVPAARMDDINARLAEPPAVDVAAFRTMGLAVVARLAHRHGIRVELRANPDGGTIADITLPGTLLQLPRSRPWEPESDAPRGVPLLDRPAAGKRPAMIGGTPTVAGSTWTGGTGEIVPVRRKPAEAWTVRAAQLTASASAAPGRGPATRVGPPGTPPAVPDIAPAALPGAPPDARPMHTLDVPSAGAPPAALPPAALPLARSAPGEGPTTILPAGSAPGEVPAAVPSAGAPPGVTGGPPVHRQIETVWFTDEDTAGRPGGTRPAGSARPRSTAGRGARAGGTRGPDPDERAVWRTAADEGWRAAARAAEPTTQDTTEVGLPKRVPLARLVPGGVHAGADPVAARRTPDAVRGLLSAYHRGVRRGRTAGQPTGGEAGG